jgi:D-tagatose-bisphosphate aldolase class II non-catalytic subunit
MNAGAQLRAIVADNRAGLARGLPSWCTAHGRTLLAILSRHRDGDDPILIEATCNQVNQHGGYTGMTPAGFRTFVEGLARQAGVDAGRIILGGDHLGPNPWKGRPAAQAMTEARAMVRAYVEAGFDKIHLDASMACADDRALSEGVMADRAAELCAVAESARGTREIVYIVGTEVPIPGGETETLDGLAVTRPEAAARTLDLHRAAFAKRGVGAAMDRVIGLVVQPGVDMGNAQVFAFDRAKAAALSAAVRDLPGVLYEAHSTDFQTGTALAELVACHFGILKVGPSLTFAFREAVVAMAAIEERLNLAGRSDILAVLAAAMDENPGHWRGYVAADALEPIARLYGLSDRIRYYWPEPAVETALQRLLANIDTARIPPGLISQFVGQMLPEDRTTPLSERIIQAKVGAVVETYRRACGAPARD